MLVGEAPGQEEDKYGRPFIGDAGQLLRSTLSLVGIPSDILYITNANRCRPKGNRTPKNAEIAACHPWLRMEIDAIKPELIVVMGANAAKSLFGSGVKHKYRKIKGLGAKGQTLYEEPTLTDLRRQSYLDFNGIPVHAAFHPIAALQRPRYRAGFLRDMEKLAERLGYKQAKDAKKLYQELTPAEVFAMLPSLSNKVVALDTEYGMQDGIIRSFSFSYAANTGYCVILDKDRDEALRSLDAVMQVAGVIPYHSMKADAKVIMDQYLAVPFGKGEDTSVMAYILGKRPVALKDLADNILGEKVIRFADIIGEFDGDIDRAILEDRKAFIRYSCQDADLTFQMYPLLLNELQQQKELPGTWQ